MNISSLWDESARVEMSNDISNQTFLITGAYGFIGAWVVKHLLASGTRIAIFDKSKER